MVSKVSFSSRARYRRLAKRAARPKRSSPRSPVGASRRSLGAMQKRAQRYARPYGTEPGPTGSSHEQEMQFRHLGEAVRDLMKAIEQGKGDLELRQLMARVRRENGYGTEMPATIFSEWPPEPEFGEVAASDAESERREAHVAKLHHCAESRVSRACAEVDHRPVPLGLVELEQIERDNDSAASVTGSSEDSLSDEYEKQPAQSLLPPASGCTWLAHMIPEPMISMPTTEGVDSVDSDSCDAASTSEREISAAHYPEHAATARLDDDFEFQQRLARWREGLPNFERQRPAQLPSACERSDEDSEYEYLYSRDEAAERLGSDEGGPALGASFRCRLSSPRLSSPRPPSSGSQSLPCATASPHPLHNAISPFSFAHRALSLSAHPTLLLPACLPFPLWPRRPPPLFPLSLFVISISMYRAETKVHGNFLRPCPMQRRAAGATRTRTIRRCGRDSVRVTSARRAGMQ